MNSNQNILMIAGTALAALLGFAFWMMFSSQPAVPASNVPYSNETQQEPSQAATPSPYTEAPMNPVELDSATDTELQKIEAEFNSSMILDEDFSELDGE